MRTVGKCGRCENGTIMLDGDDHVCMACGERTYPEVPRSVVPDHLKSNEARKRAGRIGGRVSRSLKRGGRYGYPQDLRRRAVAMHESGLSADKVGRILGVSHQSVSNWWHAEQDRRAAANE